MKIFKATLPISLAMALVFFSANAANAQIGAAEAIQLTVKKVIKAIDLKVQRMQNQTIWLQNAQKTLENELSKFRLADISNWTDKQRILYSDYYDELWKIKSIITYYGRIKDLTTKQVSMVGEYRRAWKIFQSDKHFKPEELKQMQQVYSGILDASLKNIDRLILIVNSGRTQMTDQQRLELINQAGNRLNENFDDLHRYNNQNIILCLNRSNDQNEVQTLKNIYDIH